MRVKLKANRRPYTMAEYNAEKPNPGCGHKSGIFTAETLLFTGNGEAIIGGRIRGWCNRGDCDEMFWVYPASNLITRRFIGETLKERYNRLGHY